jgi:GrpB-like predicted nucleotidyltransferase (UPF0157 family)
VSTPLGLMYGEVQLVPGGDPGWETEAHRFSDALRAALGPEAVGVEHVGSTAVPGLTAKPILDFAVGLTPEAETGRVTTALEALGYEFRGDAGDEGGLVFVLEVRPRFRVAHVHVVRHGDAQWRRYLFVRDRLRADPEARAAYAELKIGLAERYPNDRASYTAAKGSFFTALFAQAGSGSLSTSG